MANPSSEFFYFYRRYLWRSADFALLQQSLIEAPRGQAEGELGAAVLEGYEVSLNGGLSLLVSPGIADSATGYLNVQTQSHAITVTAPAGGGLPVRSLIVVSPAPTDTNLITNPTVATQLVPLNQAQLCTVNVINGTPSANPDYPETGPNDVILVGVMLQPGQTSLVQSNLDFEVRDSIGKNSLIAQNTFRFDNRLRPYRSTPILLGIKPSQGGVISAQTFMYPGKNTPSLFPLTGGVFTNSDTFLNFATGAITGGDATSSDFTPTIPTGSNSIVATVTLANDETLGVSYGTQGTYAQCKNAIINQVVSGAGAINPEASSYKIAYIIVSSVAGSQSDIEVLDARSLGGGSGSAGGSGGGAKNYLSTYNGNTGNGDFEANSTLGWSLFNTTLTGTLPTGTVTLGAASITTFAATGTNPLGAKFSLSVAASANFAAGDGFISDAFTIDNEDQARVLTQKFFYQVLTGAANMNFSGSSSNTWAVYFYDVTNNVWIQPLGLYNLIQNIGIGMSSGQFPTPSTGNQYRIALLCINAATGASSMLFDDFVVGPQSFISVPAMRDLQPYTPTITGLGTPTNVNFAWGRDGDHVIIEGYLTADSPSADPVTITLPVPLISSSIIPTQRGAAGTALFSDGTSTQFTAIMLPGVNYFGVGQQNSSSGGLTIFTGSGNISGGQSISVSVRIPIAGWSSGNTAVSADTPTGNIITAKVIVPIGSSITTGTNTPVIFPTVVYDSNDAYDPTTGLFTCPVSGFVDVTISLVDDSGGWIASVFKNGALESGLTFVGGGIASGAAQIKVNAGDTLGIYSSGAGGVTSAVTELSGATFTYRAPPVGAGVFQIGQNEIQMDEFSAYGTTDTNVVGFLDLTTNVGDSISASTTLANGTIYTILLSGLYAMGASISDTSGGTDVTMGIFKNATGAELTTTDILGSISESKRLCIAETPLVTTRRSMPSCSRTSWLTAGDLIRVQTDSGVNPPLSGNQFWITRIA